MLDAFEVVFLYLIQSIFIGINYVGRSTADVIRQRKKGSKVGFFGPLFFTFHYGTFHLVYAVFILFWYAGADAHFSKIPILFGTAGILLNTIFSTFSDIKADKEQGGLTPFAMFIPYFRIIPMHLMILFGNNDPQSKRTFLLFMGLKIFFDIIMHVVVNQTWKHIRPSRI